MNLYELLTILVEGHTWNHEARKADALQLLRDLEAIGALGTVVGYTETTAHEHVWQPKTTDQVRWMECSVCHGETIKIPYVRGVGW